jgi:hypothetical protein
VIQLIGGPNGLTERKVARQDDVFSLERDDEGALHGPRTYPGNRGEFRHELVVRQPAQRVGVQPAVRQPPGQVAERADLPPRQPGLAELTGIFCQQFSG